MDDTLFVEAQLLLQEVRAAVDGYRETSPITSFTSIFFGVFQFRATWSSDPSRPRFTDAQTRSIGHRRSANAALRFIFICYRARGWIEFTVLK